MSMSDQFTDTPAENFYEIQDLLGIDPGYNTFLDALNCPAEAYCQQRTPQEEVTMDYSNEYKSESKFLKADDLKGQAVKVTIASSALEAMTQDQAGDHKVVIMFKDKEKGMALNKTNYNALVSVFGTESDNWNGKEIEIFAMAVDYQGKSVMGLRLRVLNQASENPAAGMDDFPDDDLPF